MAEFWQIAGGLDSLGRLGGDARAWVATAVTGWNGTRYQCVWYSVPSGQATGWYSVPIWLVRCTTVAGTLYHRDWYTVPMVTTGRIAVCDECGHRWLPASESLPARCPSRKCRSVGWNAAGSPVPPPETHGKANPANRPAAAADPLGGHQQATPPATKPASRPATRTPKATAATTPKSAATVPIPCRHGLTYHPGCSQTP